MDFKRTNSINHHNYKNNKSIRTIGLYLSLKDINSIIDYSNKH